VCRTVRGLLRSFCRCLVIYVTSFDSPDIPVHLIPGSSVNDTDGCFIAANLSQRDYQPCSSVSYFFGEIFGQLFRISRVNFQNHGLIWLSGYLKSWRSPFSSVPVAISAREHARTSGIGLYSFAIYIRTRVRKLSRRSSRLLDRDLARPHAGLFWCRSGFSTAAKGLSAGWKRTEIRFARPWTEW